MEEKNYTSTKMHMSINAYRKMKLRMLKKDFRITLTQEELDHAETLTSEVKLDQFCLGMINKYWG